MAAFLLVCTSLLAAAFAITLQRDLHDSGTGEKGLDAPELIEKAQASMKARPNDLDAQLAGCTSLVALSMTQRGAPGPFGGRKVGTPLLKAGIGEALAQGLLNSVAIERAQGRTEPSAASSACFAGLTGLVVQNDYFKGLALINHAPHLWDAVVAFFRAFKGSTIADASLCTFAGLFGTPQPFQAAAAEVKAGGIDFVLEYLEDESLKLDPAMFQRVYCALSDPVHEASGVVARAIANYRGPLQGIPLMVRSLRWARESGSTYHEQNGFGLLYEGVHDVGGVMEHDDANHSFAKAFVEAGLVEQLVPIMMEEPGDRQLQDMSCEAIKWITDDNVLVQKQLVQAGALELMAEALKRHSHPPSKAYGIVTIACSTALLNFASSSAAWRDELRRLGVYDTLDEEVFAMFSRFGLDDFIMRLPWFPNQNIYKLKELLAPVRVQG